MKIKKVEKGSLAEKYGVAVGDEIIQVNNRPIGDAIDYRFYSAGEEEIRLRLTNKKGRIRNISIKKKPEQDLGIVLGEDRYRRCPNRCIFCFVDQLPRGLRRSLYFKDEDYRLSFLHGNFITLTNLSDDDIQRIIEQRISPLYVSVHTTDEHLRKQMLGNKRIPDVLPLIKKLSQNRIELHAQIVLCPGINDQNYLRETVFDLASFYPQVRSVAIVPVGLTKFRKSLPRIRSVSNTYSREIIKQVAPWQKLFRRKLKENLVYLADEFFLKAGLDIPSARYYDDFYQIENGVGLVRKFIDDLKKASNLLPRKLKRKTEITLIAASLSAKFMRRIVNEETKGIKNLKVRVVEVANSFFGNSVTVSGLLAGKDILDALRNRKKLGQIILLPPNCVNVDNRFLDDLTPRDLEEKLSRKVVVGSYDLVETFLNIFESGQLI